MYSSDEEGHPYSVMLANMTLYPAVGEQFGVGLSNATEALISVCLAIEMVLLKRTVHFRNVRKVGVTIANFLTTLF